jgi:hypothetical protein
MAVDLDVATKALLMVGSGFSALPIPKQLAPQFTIQERILQHTLLTSDWN